MPTPTRAADAAREAAYVNALTASRGDRTLAAQALGVSRSALQAWLARHPGVAARFPTRPGPKVPPARAGKARRKP